MSGRTSTDDDVVRKQQERDLGHPERPGDAAPREPDDKKPGGKDRDQAG